MVCFGHRYRPSKCVLVARARVTEASHRRNIDLILPYSSGTMSVFLFSRSKCAKVSIESKSVASVPALFLKVQASCNCISTIRSSLPGYPAHHPMLCTPSSALRLPLRTFTVIPALRQQSVGVLWPATHVSHLPVHAQRDLKWPIQPEQSRLETLALCSFCSDSFARHFTEKYSPGILARISGIFRPAFRQEIPCSCQAI
jgi:hypothetical protein